jgi:adenine-specific DNA-methyltransferase
VVRKEKGPVQMSLFPYFESPENNPPLREALHFYKHSQNWSNRLIAGDSLLVMNSLLQKESMAGKVQMIYFDPPYGIKYGSNFQPFLDNSNVRDGKDEDLTQEPETIKAFRDTWELGVHSYLTYIRDRLLLARELLSETGSIFMQISDKNLHLVRNVLDEVFGADNFVALIPFRKKTMPFGTNFIEQMSDFLLWYAKQKYNSSGQPNSKYHRLFVRQDVEGEFHYCWFELPDGSRHRMDPEQVDNHRLLPKGGRVYRLKSLEPSGRMDSGMYDYKFEGRVYPHPKNGYGTTPEGMDQLTVARRLQAEGNRLTFIMYADESTVTALTSPWSDTVGADDKMYAVQTNTEVIRRCMLMTTNPGDIVLDPTCGAGTTAYVAEQGGRRWITCDTSRVAIALARQRLITATFPYFELAYPNEGVASDFKYKTTPHITLASIANREQPGIETLYNQPVEDKSKKRISGPFTVEAVPSQRTLSLNEVDGQQQGADASVSRSGESVRMSDWIDELLISGIYAKSGKKIEFSRLEALGATRYLHAEGETKEEEPKHAVVSFSSAYAPLGKEQVELAIEEAQRLVPKPRVLVFAAFQFDPEAARDIDETNWPGVSLLKAQMNTDLFTSDLKKKRSSNESFMLVGQPDVELARRGRDNYIVKVNGFDYYNPTTGEIESGDVSRIAMWMLDTDYDGRSLYPRQIFFPMAGKKDGWAKIGKSLMAELDEDMLDRLYTGDVSLSFELGDRRRVAVKIIDDRGIESLRIIEAKE